MKSNQELFLISHKKNYTSRIVICEKETVLVLYLFFKFTEKTKQNKKILFVDT